MSSKPVIAFVPGIRLVPSKKDSRVAIAEVDDFSARFSLPWDRFMRLSAAANYVRKAGAKGPILDIGGFDGALALFLPENQIHLVDPATTSGTGLDLPVADSAYETVVSIDVLEHIEPQQREKFVAEQARTAQKNCIVNFPSPSSATAQKLVAELTGNQFIKEHTTYGLPHKGFVEKLLQQHGFTTESHQHTSTAVWASSFVLNHFAPEAAAKVHAYLVEDAAHFDCPDPIYSLVIGSRLT